MSSTLKFPMCYLPSNKLVIIFKIVGTVISWYCERIGLASDTESIWSPSTVQASNAKIISNM